MESHKKYSQLRAMMAIALASWRSTLRSPSAVVFTLFFPLIFIVVFGFIGGGGFKVHIATEPGTDTTNVLFQQLKHNPSITFSNAPTPAKDLDDLQKGHIDALLSITATQPHDGPPHLIVKVTTSKASFEGGNFVKNLVSTAVDKMNLSVAQNTHQVAEFRQAEVQGRAYKRIDFILPGQLGFSLLSTGVFGTAFVFLSLRQTLVIKRFFATPVNRMYIVLGEALSRLVFALVGAIIIITIGRFAFGFTLIHGISTVLTMLLLSAISLIVFMGFGFVISGIAKTESTVPPLANIITLPQFLLSGTFFSIDVFPKWLQPISRALPLTYLNDALRKVAFEGAGLMDVGFELLMLCIWGVIVYVAAAKLFRWE